MERRWVGRGSGARLNLQITATSARKPARWLSPSQWYMTPEGRCVFASAPADVQIVVGFENHWSSRHPGKYRYGFVCQDGRVAWDPPVGWPSCSVDELTPAGAIRRCPLCCAVACPYCEVRHTSDCPDRVGP